MSYEENIPGKQLPERKNPKKYPEGQFCYRYPHAAIAADCVIFGFNGKNLKILLIERGQEPFKDYWALPGGFMRMDETIEETAERELEEETNIKNVYLDQFKVYSNVKRDPRERVVSIAFIALVKPEDCDVVAGDDAAKAMWFDDGMLPPLAFDHALIIREAREYLKDILYRKPVAFELLSKTFTISQLQAVYEEINQATYDRRNFLRTALEAEVITEVDDDKAKDSGRNVKRYRLNKEMASEAEHPDYQRLPSPPGEIMLNDENLNFGFQPETAKDDLTLSDDTSSEVKRKNAPTKGLFGFLSRRK